MTRSAIRYRFSLDRQRGAVRQSRRRSVECRRPRSGWRMSPTRRTAARIDIGSISGSHAASIPTNPAPGSCLTARTIMRQFRWRSIEERTAILAGMNRPTVTHAHSGLGDRSRRRATPTRQPVARIARTTTTSQPTTRRDLVIKPIAALPSMAGGAAHCQSELTPIPTMANRNRPTNPPTAAFFLTSNLANRLPSCQLPRGPKPTHSTALKSSFEPGLNAIQTTANDGLPNHLHVTYINVMVVLE